MKRSACLMILPLLLLAGRSEAAAQDKIWADVAEFSYVVTGGNASSATLGFTNKLTWDLGGTAFELSLGAIRAESTTLERIVTAAGPPPVVSEISDTRLTAESYRAGLAFNRSLTEKMFLYAGTGWKRNRFSGVENQFSAAGGIGTAWIDEEGHSFKTEYAATWTSQEDVVPGPEGTRSFAGARLTWSYMIQLSESTTYTNDLAVDENLKDTADLRADMVNSLQVAMSRSLALKVSLQLLYDNQPALTAAADPDALLGAGETVLIELEKLDTIMTVSLVVNF
jgi:putative salt-induced outer membrane protein